MATRPTPRTRSNSSETKQHSARKRAPVLFRLPNLRSDGPHSQLGSSAPPSSGSVEPVVESDKLAANNDSSSESKGRWSGPVLLVAIVGLLGAAIYFQGRQGSTNVDNTMAVAGISDDSLQPNVSFPDFQESQLNQTEPATKVAMTQSQKVVDVPLPTRIETGLVLNGSSTEPAEPLLDATQISAAQSSMSQSSTTDSVGLLLSGKTDDKVSGPNESDGIDPPSLVGASSKDESSIEMGANSMVGSSSVSVVDQNTVNQNNSGSNSGLTQQQGAQAMLPRLSEEELKNLGIPQILAARQQMFDNAAPATSQLSNTLVSTSTPDFDPSGLANLVNLSQPSTGAANSAPFSTVSGSPGVPQTRYGVPPAAPGYSTNMQQPVTSNKNYPAYQPVFNGGVPSAGSPVPYETQPNTYPTNVPAGQTDATTKPYQPIGPSLYPR